jgi:ribonuclease P/MRP protein subunit RPP1
MFYDLNVLWSANDKQLPRTLAFLQELGYNVVALNHIISGKLPADLVRTHHNTDPTCSEANNPKTCPIPSPLPPKDAPKDLTILRRCTLVLTESYQNARLADLSRNYDLLALRPVDERTLSLACSSLDCDIISLDLTVRLPFHFKYKQLSEAIRAGKRFEISYAQGVLGDSGQRRNLISNATQLIRASRGRGLIISSEAQAAVACRGPWDAVNLAAVWGLGQERGYEAVSKECRSVVVGARLKRTSYRGVVDIVYGGEKPAPPKKDDVAEGKAKQAEKGQKRKAEVMEESGSSTPANGESGERPLSKRQMRRQAHQARLRAAEETGEAAERGDDKDVNVET